MSSAALLAVAHGSPDPRAEPVLEALMARVRAERPGLVAKLAHLGHTDPDVATAVRSLVEAGSRRVVVVPLLLTAAFHARTDLPALLDELRAELPSVELAQTPVLGPHPLLLSLVRRRLTEVGADPAGSLVLGAVGTSDAGANAELADVAARLGAAVGFAAGEPSVDRVVDELRADTGGQVAIASYVLAPGTLPDRFAATKADLVTQPLGAEPEIVSIVLERFDAVG
ncbi:MAG TPA: CbiX/SirB N-terminal domain-containing protein [Acidothermaceae bacterium]